MDDQDAAQACALIPHCQYSKIDSDHVIHRSAPCFHPGNWKLYWKNSTTI